MICIPLAGTILFQVKQRFSWYEVAMAEGMAAAVMDMAGIGADVPASGIGAASTRRTMGLVSGAMDRAGGVDRIGAAILTMAIRRIHMGRIPDTAMDT